MAELQENARRLKIELAPGDLSQLVTEIAGQLNGANGSATSGPDTGDLSILVELALQSTEAATPTAEEVARRKDFATRFGGSSWTGASHSGFGGSSSA